MTKTPPIEALRWAVDVFAGAPVADGYEEVRGQEFSDAYDALGQVETLAAKAEAMKEPRGHTDWHTDYCAVCGAKEVKSALPPLPLFHDADCPWLALLAALGPFQAEATHDHAPGFPAHEHPDGEPPPRIVDSSQSS